ncbi:WYL domain-containing protein [Cytobacillus kochii]|uniref:WYL domain-containing protein n=1 Tax=Cytobacillus kochii TaxID=859143 RepID=UPI00203AA8AF|nr:WYL domain-containing protein [Cytobacillus kochii]MCM3324221.1 WYL domain-containing protein [Cytobacillus kochii]MCM3346710.1 WYL domain-containing protein [Cytobacillus kochii]
MKGLLIRGVNNKEELEMIYLDNKGDISQRRIKILSVYEDYFRAYCFSKQQQRTFKVSNVLSIGPVRKVRRGA